MKKQLTKITALVMAFVLSFVTLASTDSIQQAYAKGGSKEPSASITPTPTPTPKLSKQEKAALESIMPGLSKFKFEGYEWPESLTVGGLAFSIAESLYTMRNSKNHKKTVLWNDEEITNEMKNFYSTTDWTKFEGMQETVQISNSCEAILSEEVQQYEKLLDAAAEENGFKIYKEIFKAIAQARFNENKKEYERKKAKGKIKGKGTDKFDLFHIDGSWIDGGDTPVGKAKAATPTPMPSVTVTPSPDPSKAPSEILISSPTPMPATDDKSPDEKNYDKENYTVQESINLAAEAFASILQNAVYPSPYDTNDLISVVQGFEFGGSSNAIKNQYNSSSVKLDGINGFIAFAEYCDKKSLSGNKSESETSEETDYDKIIESYAKVIADNKTRYKNPLDEDDNDYGTYGKYKYSDQKFYSKVFENYRCSGGGSIDYGNLPDDMKEILRQCMQTWDSRVTKERRAIIQNGILLYGVTYSMDYARTDIKNPKYLDCSSFVGQCYWRSGVATQGSDAAYWSTPTISGVFTEISESQLIPGDIGQKCWPGQAYGADHVGIYIGTVNGTRYWLHCTGGTTDGVYHAPGKGVKINNYGGFLHYGRYPGL